MQSRMRPLEFASSTANSFSSSFEEDHRSEYSDSTEQSSITLVPVQSQTGSPSESVPSLSSSSYVTPIPSPFLSPQSSFYSCRSSICYSSQNELGRL